MLRMFIVLLTRDKLVSLHCSIILKVNAMIIVINVQIFGPEQKALFISIVKKLLHW